MLNSTSSDALVGWTAEPDGRGTWVIITTSLTTILLCTWTAIHPRAHTDRRIVRRHKLAQLVKAILAPEMVCLESLQEWVQARKMVARSKDATNGGLKMVHAFYIGMLGIRYETQRGHCVLWPSQYVWLLNNGLVRWQEAEAWGLSERAILDKNKADGLVKLSAMCQVLWFLLQCILRTTKELPIAPLETMTIAYVLIVMITYSFWWLKPKDIATASLVTLPAMTSVQRDIFESLKMEDNYDYDCSIPEKSRNIAWYLVSRDCKDDQVLMTCHDTVQEASDDSEISLQHTSVQPDISSPLITARSSLSGTWSTPTEICTDLEQNVIKQHTVITEWDASLYMSKPWPLICITGAAFGAFHLISWNSTFPTNIESLLWRVSAVTSVISSILCMQFRAVVLRWEGPLTIVCIGSPLVYLITRVIMMVQAFACLRAMPADMYDTPAFSDYFIRFS